MQCFVYRSKKQDEMYLYLLEENKFELVPESLLQRFGSPEPALTFDLSARKKMARVDIEKLRQALAAQGYFLQMPPQIHAHLTQGE